MTVDEAALSAKYGYTLTTVRGSTQITKRVSAVLASLQHDKPAVVALRASARAAVKLISIVEIIKRQMKAESRPVFQYTALTSELVDYKPKVMSLPTDDSGEESDEAFEPVKVDGEVSQRQSPVMTIYLSTSSICELRLAYSEQTG